LFCWYWWSSLYSMVWDKRWLLVLLILVTITVFNGMRQEVITCFVDIGDHHCIQWHETRGDYLFCWYWWPSLYSMVWDKRWLLVLLILVTITLFNGMRQEVIACFVDIGDHHCIQWYETRGDYLFCWYWWPSLYSMVWDKRWLLVLLILVTITVFNGMRQEVITCFVDIGDHHCIQWYETRGDYLFCWYWWLSLLKLSFHKMYLYSFKVT
jgi:succinate dehydrogenase hydrophobic anchor subunit